MRLIARFLGGLWDFSNNTWISVFPDLRPRSGASAITVFLFLLFFIIGGVLVLLGFDLDDVDRWLDGQVDWLDAIGSFLFRLLCGAILLASVAVVAGGLYQMLFAPARRPDDEDGSIGWGAVLVFAVVGYFSWFGVVG